MALTDIDGQRLGDSVADKLGDRNLIINGAMQVAQRSTSVTGITAGGYRTLDRFRMSAIDSGFGTVSLDQSTDVPANQGFVSSFKVECTTSPGNPYPDTDAAFIDQRIEAQNLQHLKYGTANAENITVSFWAKASEGGTYCLCIHQDDPNKSYVKEYTLVAGVWKYVSLTFPGNTADVINNDNGSGFIVAWILSTGADNQMAAEAWATPPNNNGINGTANQNQLFDTAGAEFYLTGVQLEVGNTATPFQHRSYADELARCQRYYQKLTRNAVGTRVGIGQAVSTSNVEIVIPFVTTMRTPPTALEQSGTASDYGLINATGSGGDCTSVPSFRFAGIDSIMVRFFFSGHVIAGNASQAYLDQPEAFLAWSAEL
jgi:hypothetical protein